MGFHQLAMNAHQRRARPVGGLGGLACLTFLGLRCSVFGWGFDDYPW
jgi:hypothetical protein